MTLDELIEKCKKQNISYDRHITWSIKGECTDDPDVRLGGAIDGWERTCDPIIDIPRAVVQGRIYEVVDVAILPAKDRVFLILEKG